MGKLAQALDSLQLQDGQSDVEARRREYVQFSSCSVCLFTLEAKTARCQVRSCHNRGIVESSSTDTSSRREPYHELRLSPLVLEVSKLTARYDSPFHCDLEFAVRFPSGDKYRS
jgi:hypothetical protein